MTFDTGAPVATSVAADGSVERAELRGGPGERVFTYLHVPASEPAGAVLVCSPLHGEFARNYRREVLLARSLAARGHVVLRFHYRHTGNSDGDETELTYGSMCEDALWGAGLLRAEAPGAPLVVLGTRWGSLIAASVAGRLPEASVVMWEPLPAASRFFRDAFRSRLVREVRRGVERPAGTKELEERLRGGESVDVVAHRLYPNLFRTSIDRTIEEELGSSPRRVLVVQVGPTGAVRPEVARLAETWTAAGMRVDTRGVRGDETWWLVEERFVDEGAKTLTGELIDITTAWITEGGGA